MNSRTNGRDNLTQPPVNTASSSRLQVPGQEAAATTATITTPSSSASSPQAIAGASRLSPVPSLRSSVPATPDAVDESRGGYFENLSRAVSNRSWASGRSDRPLPSLTSTTTSRPGQGSRRPSIRIRRTSAASSINSINAQPNSYAFPGFDTTPGIVGGDGSSSHNAGQTLGRSRSASLTSGSRGPPGVSNAARHSQRVPQVSMPRLTEEGARPTMAELGVGPPLSPAMSLPEHTLSGGPVGAEISEPAAQKSGRRRKVSRLFWPSSGKKQDAQQQDAQGEAGSSIRGNDEYDEELVDWLDIIDPEVQALSTLTNVQNSLFIPDLGSWINRRPAYILSERDPRALPLPSSRPPTRDQERPAIMDQEQPEASGLPPPSEADEDDARARMQRSNTITSRLTDSHYAALPHGATLDGWTAAEKSELDDHVRHMLHSRRAKFKRSMKGFGQYVRRPLGFFVTLYATLITLFGLAWVLFLIGWIYVGEKQVYAIHVIDSVLVALFAIMGDGLAPFRIVDTYHMIFVARYSRMLRKGLKGTKSDIQKQEQNSTAEIRESDIEISGNTPAADNGRDTTNSPTLPIGDVEEAKSDIATQDESPLTAAQQKSLDHHQKKLAKSHSFYKPHETYTHHSFPLGHLIAIVVLLDCHSCLQISLGACTWGINYHVRPFALTTVILCVSITCNLTAGLVIMLGDRKTRKKDVMELLNRRELTEDAMREVRPPPKEEVEQEKESKKPNTQAEKEMHAYLDTEHSRGESQDTLSRGG